jgi:hypothetical protein
MEGIEAEIQNKSIEKSIEIKEVEAPQKEKKPRSQAQKEAFEKARKKRAENLAKKKADEVNYSPINANGTEEVAQVEDIKPAPKRRGRPKKLTKNQEPQLQSFIPPPDPQLYQYPYQVQNQAQFNPYQYWGGMPQQAPQPVVNNYYYGEQHHHQTKQEQKIHTPELPQYEPEPSPEGSIDYDYCDEEEIDYPPTEPQLKYRFA